MIVVDPHARQDAVPVSVKQIGPGKFRCEYIPREPGLHSVNIFFAGRPIPNSPYGVNVASCMYHMIHFCIKFKIISVSLCLLEKIGNRLIVNKKNCCLLLEVEEITPKRLSILILVMISRIHRWRSTEMVYLILII